MMDEVVVAGPNFASGMLLSLGHSEIYQTPEHALQAINPVKMTNRPCYATNGTKISVLMWTCKSRPSGMVVRQGEGGRYNLIKGVMFSYLI